jgi:hypothetical protein
MIPLTGIPLSGLHCITKFGPNCVCRDNFLIFVVTFSELKKYYVGYTNLVTALLNRKVWKFNVGTFQSLIEIPLKDQLKVKP